MLDVQSFREADCDSDYCVVFAKVREILAVSKQDMQKFDREIFTLRQLNVLEVMKQYQIEISKMFADLEKLSDTEGIRRAWENMRDNNKISAKGSLGLY